MAAGDFGLRHARWRAWIRVHTPDFLYDRGLIVPKAADCGEHEWHNAGNDIDGCFHCKVEPAHVGPPWTNPLGPPPTA